MFKNKNIFDLSVLDFDKQAYLVNSIKLSLLRKLDGRLVGQGKINLKKVLLTPIFDFKLMEKRIKLLAPELITFFYKEADSVIKKLEK